MELVLERTYHPTGTDGRFLNGAQLVCRAIELPWRENKQRLSCIPEGRYQLVKRYSQRYRWHLLLKDVPGRELILIHAANDAAKELQGCIAPVTDLSAPGKGNRSRLALEKLQRLVFEALERKEQVFLTVKRRKV